MEQILDLRKATVADIKTIHTMLLSGAAGGLLLSRSLSQLYNHVRDFYVLCDRSNKVMGCCAFSVVWEDLAEVRSLFLDTSLRGRGYGSVLIRAGLEDIKALGIRRLFTLTYNTAFFSHMGFTEVSKDILPQKVWADCVNCPKFPDCDEVAMILPLV